jgi:hypothetical protein
VQKKKQPPADPAAAFYNLLDKLLKVSRQDIQEAFETHVKRTSPPEATYSHGGVPGIRSRTANSD